MHWISPNLDKLLPSSLSVDLCQVCTSTYPLAILHLWLATMVSPAALAFNCHVIPLISKFPKNDESSYTPLTMLFCLEATTQKSVSIMSPLCPQVMSKLFCHSILEFQDVSAGARLSLTTGPLKFTYYWTINLCGGKQFKILALTTMDTATNLLEIEPLQTKMASECA